eukprot:2967758-Pyramimonas_sp.AAC.3
MSLQMPAHLSVHHFCGGCAGHLRGVLVRRVWAGTLARATSCRPTSKPATASRASSISPSYTWHRTREGALLDKSPDGACDIPLLGKVNVCA